MELYEAQLYWDGYEIDPIQAGWVLRYRDSSGSDTLVEVGETEDASIETLAYQVADCVPERATGRIRVGSHARPRGTITLQEGVIESWKAGH